MRPLTDSTASRSGMPGAARVSYCSCLPGRRFDRTSRTGPEHVHLKSDLRTEFSDSLRRRVAYVHQQAPWLQLTGNKIMVHEADTREEMLLECYTPKEHLLFQSTLRMPRDVTSTQRRDRVEKCIHLLLVQTHGGASTTSILL